MDEVRRVPLTRNGDFVAAGRDVSDHADGHEGAQSDGSELGHCKPAYPQRKYSE